MIRYGTSGGAANSLPRAAMPEMPAGYLVSRSCDAPQVLGDLTVLPAADGRSRQPYLSRFCYLYWTRKSLNGLASLFLSSHPVGCTELDRQVNMKSEVEESHGVTVGMRFD